MLVILIHHPLPCCCYCSNGQLSHSVCFFLLLPGPQVNPLDPDSDDEPQQQGVNDAACAKQSANASGDAVALLQQQQQEPATQDAAATRTANEARSVAQVDAPSVPQGRRLGSNVMPGAPGGAEQPSEGARKAPSAKQQQQQQQQQQPFSHGKAKGEGRDKDVAGTEDGRAKGPMSTHSSMAQQKKQVQGHRGALLRPEPEPEVVEDVQSSDSEDYSAMKKAAAMSGKRAPQRGSRGDAEGFEVVSAVRSRTPAIQQPPRKRQAHQRSSAGGSRPEPMRTPRGGKAPRNGPQMEGIDDSWLASIAMR